MSATPSRLLLPALLLALTTQAAQAQSRFSMGPVLGGVISSASYVRDENYTATSRPGFEAGIEGVLHLRGVFSLQASLGYSQRGYHLDTRPTNTPIFTPDLLTTRLKYLTLPLNLVISQHTNGQGLQLFGWFYVGLLLGGHYTHTYTYGGVENTLEADIDLAHDPDYFHYSAAQVDAGVQGGLGYRLGGALLQVGYSYGITDLSSHYTGSSPKGPIFFNRAWQASLSYLLPVGKN